MTEKMNAFLAEAEKDAALAEKIAGAVTPEALIALAAEKGYALTEADLAEEERTGELDDDELDMASGGKTIVPLVNPWWILRHTPSSSKGPVVTDDLVHRGGGTVLSDLVSRGGGTAAVDMMRWDGSDNGDGSVTL